MDSLALVLTGGGARAAYQVGVLRCVARRLPDTRLDIITGVSAGAINAMFLASRSGSLSATVDELTNVWVNLTLKDVIRIDSLALIRDANNNGVIDNNVLFQDSARLYERLIELHKDNFSMSIYPLDRHAFTNADSWLDEYKRIYKLFESNLK